MPNRQAPMSLHIAIAAKSAEKTAAAAAAVAAAAAAAAAVLYLCCLAAVAAWLSMHGNTCCSPDGSEVSVLSIVVKEAPPLPACLWHYPTPQQLPKCPAQQDVRMLLHRLRTHSHVCLHMSVCTDGPCTVSFEFVQET